MKPNKNYQHVQQLLLARLADIFGRGNKTITVSHDPTGDMTGAQFGAYHLSFDLADCHVYAPGTRFTHKNKTARWDGQTLRVLKPTSKKSNGIRRRS